jgi:hypothetical protein
MIAHLALNNNRSLYLILCNLDSKANIIFIISLCPCCIHLPLFVLFLMKMCENYLIKRDMSKYLYVTTKYPQFIMVIKLMLMLSVFHSNSNVFQTKRRNR